MGLLVCTKHNLSTSSLAPNPDKGPSSYKADHISRSGFFNDHLSSHRTPRVLLFEPSKSSKVCVDSTRVLILTAAQSSDPCKSREDISRRKSKRRVLSLSALRIITFSNRGYVKERYHESLDILRGGAHTVKSVAGNATSGHDLVV